MPRVLSASSCLTCRRRKLKCDESEPICDRCLRAGRYCDRGQGTEYLNTVVYERPQEDVSHAQDPRLSLQDPGTARLYHHYITDLATWYDLSDRDRSFARQVPYKALSRPLLFHAIIAFAAIHTTRTSAPSMRSVAEYHHSRCVELLISLNEDEIRSSNGIALAAVCLLRSYEILAEETDPNRHLSGACALAASQPVDFNTPSMARAGFFNYLREDITFSLMTRQPLKIDLGDVSTAYLPTSDEDHLNVATLLLAKIINVAFGGNMSEEASSTLGQQLQAYQATLPSHFQPYSNASATPHGSVFPSIWMLADCHVAVAQYHLVSRSVLRACAQTDPDTQGDLHIWAARVCGLAFTCASTSVLINSFGPICFCGRYIASEPLQAELVRSLEGCRKQTGWPVQRIIADLQQYWEHGAGNLT